MSKISIFMSSYNYAEFLPAAIESVLNQTFQDFELYILDDASTDASWQIIQSYSDSRIIAHRNPVNQHSVAGLNHFISEIASGELIAVHHSDNLWELNKLEKQLDYLDAHPEIGAVFTDVHVIDENGAQLKDPSNPYFSLFKGKNRSRHEWLNFFFMHGNCLCHPSILIRKKCYADCGLYRFGLGLLLDMDMWVRLCLKHEIHILPEKLVSYRIFSSEENISGNRPDTRIRYLFEYLKIFDNYRDIPSMTEYLKVFPSAQKYAHQDDWDIGFVLGMTALKERGNSHIFQFFGLNLLFNALQDPLRSKKLENLYGFTHKDLIELTGQHDIFSINFKACLRQNLSEKSENLQKIHQNIERLKVQVAEKNKHIHKQREKNKILHSAIIRKNKALSKLEARLVKEEKTSQELNDNLAENKNKIESLTITRREIESSAAWKTGTLLIRALAILAPPSSHRYQFLKCVYRKLLKPIFAQKALRKFKGQLSLITSSGLFNPEWYLANNPDVAEARMDPAEHYLLYGGLEGRDPGPNFDSRKYLEHYEEARQAGINPLLHYLQSHNQGD